MPHTHFISFRWSMSSREEAGCNFTYPIAAYALGEWFGCLAVCQSIQPFLLLLSYMDKGGGGEMWVNKMKGGQAGGGGGRWEEKERGGKAPFHLLSLCVYSVMNDPTRQTNRMDWTPFLGGFVPHSLLPTDEGKKKDKTDR
jgi:hypothetical protein